jgi:hypothetical protein
MRFALCCAVAVMVAAGGAVASDRQLEGAALRQAVAGKTVNLETPLGGLPISFRIDGTMHAKTIELASYTGSTQDRGIWWIATNRLCQRWNNWLNGKAYCFTLRQQGRNVHWTRNDGVTGLATIRR